MKKRGQKEHAALLTAFFNTRRKKIEDQFSRKRLTYMQRHTLRVYGRNELRDRYDNR